MQGFSASPRHAEQQTPRIITSGKEELILLIDTLLRCDVPEQELNGLFQELGYETYRNESNRLNPDRNNHPNI